MKRPRWMSGAKDSAEMRKSMEYYTSEKLNERITAIRSKSGEIMYLIEGEEKAVLIDTCIGIGGLKDFIRQIRTKDTPLTVLISHGHIDHAMGAPEFEEVYMNPRDISLYQSQCSIKERRGYAGIGLGAMAESLPDDAFVPASPDYEFHALEEGMVFALGGVSVEVYNAYGHTGGCMAFLIPEEKVLILGDACNNATFLFDDICSSVEAYQQSMRELKAKVAGKYDRVFVMHHIIDAPVFIIDEMIELCDDILAGNVDNVPYEFMGKQAVMAKAANARMERGDGKFANLIYNPNHIRQ